MTTLEQTATIGHHQTILEDSIKTMSDDDELDEEMLLDGDDEPEMDEEEEEMELLRSEGIVDALEENIRRDFALKALADITLGGHPNNSPNNTTTDEDDSSSSSVDGHRFSAGSLSPPNHSVDSPPSSSELSSSGSFSTGSTKSKSSSTRPAHEKKHKCNTCGKAFSYLSILESHKRSHTGEKPFNCRFCDKKFAQKATLQVHERTHTGERPYKCKYCEKTFAQYGTKTVHEKSAHLGIRNYKCPLCEKNLSSPSALYTHKKTHGDKVFNCEFCTKTFTLKNYLKLHVKQVHEQNERKHVCTYCQKSFAYAGSLQVHVRTHTGERPYSCKFCPKAFASQGNLQSHERTHTGERPYACKQCERTFIQKSQLTAHEATHNGGGAEKKHSTASSTASIHQLPIGEHTCAGCSKRFSYATNLCPYCGVQASFQIRQRPLSGDKPHKCAGCGKGYAQKIGLRAHWEQCPLFKARARVSSESPINVETDSDGTFEDSPKKLAMLGNYEPSAFSVPVVSPAPLKLNLGFSALPRPLPLQIPPHNYGPLTASKPPFSADCSLPEAFAFQPCMQTATAQLADQLLPPTPTSSLPTPTLPPLDPALLSTLLSAGGPNALPQLQLLLQLQQQSQTEALVQQLLLGSLPSPLLQLPQLNPFTLPPLPTSTNSLLTTLHTPTPMKPDAAVAASALLQLSTQAI